ncbi:MAG: hypothetical protein MZV70_69585 [Desulfobacterales bacterium]|nr:hypothetical protein [Desulfobacterales bacterium]
MRLDPLSDPEFLKVYQQNVGRLKSQYQSALDQAKEDLAAMLGIEKESKKGDYNKKPQRHRVC